MIDHDVLQRTLGVALRTGGDFAEVFVEDKRSTSAGLDDGKVEQVTSGHDRGAGIRVVAGDTTGFAHTADLSEKGLQAAAEAAAAAARAGGGGARIVELSKVTAPSPTVSCSSGPTVCDPPFAGRLAPVAMFGTAATPPGVRSCASTRRGSLPAKLAAGVAASGSFR